MSKKENPDFWRTKKKKDGSLEWESFDQYDSKSAEKKLNPKGRAHSFAVSDKGVRDDSVLTTDEVEMLADINDHITQLREWFSRGVGAIKDKITSLTTDVDIETNFARIKADLNSKNRNALTDYHHDKDEIYRDSDQALRELRSFRIENKLQNRPATYPESILYHFAIVFVALVGEAMANSYFFGQASDTGLLGGFSTAFLVSLGNVAFSMLAGFAFLRQINHKSIIRKVMGLVAFVGSLIGLGFLHLAIAHYREILTRNPDAYIQSDVLGPLMENPFGLQDVESILLIFIGVVISAIAIWKGYTMDDPYPGYGSVFSKWKDLDDQMIEKEREIKHQIADAHDRALKDAQGVLVNMKTAKQELELLKGDIGAYLSCYEAYYATARNAGVRFVSTFRNIIQTIYNDQERFPYQESLLDGKGGIEKLDPGSGRREVEALLSDSIENLNVKIKKFPTMLDQFTTELARIYSKETSTENIRKVTKDLPRFDEQRNGEGEFNSSLSTEV